MVRPDSEKAWGDVKSCSNGADQMNADQKSDQARRTSSQCNLWLEHPAKAHAEHEAAAAAHDNEAVGLDRERHLRLAKEHRALAQYWAKREIERSR